MTLGTLFVTIRRDGDGREFPDVDGVSADRTHARRKAEQAATTIPQWHAANPIIRVEPFTQVDANV